jgi:multimeric flavodoxin WrbA
MEDETMKILVVIGSPHKGKTYDAVKKIQAHMQARGNVEFDTLWLKEAQLGPCTGCHACIFRGEEKCPLRDDRAAIEARMMAADGLILASPVYCQQVTYLMKIYFDHFAFLWHRPRFFGKYAMPIATGGGQFKETLAYMEQNARAWGYSTIKGAGAPHMDALVPKMRANVERDLEKAADRFYSALTSKKTPAPSLFQLVWFRMWRINARACKDSNPADFNYWNENGWFQQDYYTGTPVGLFQRIFGGLMEKVLKRVMRSVYVGY